jgi:hypothetical protein
MLITNSAYINRISLAMVYPFGWLLICEKIKGNSLCPEGLSIHDNSTCPEPLCLQLWSDADLPKKFNETGVAQILAITTLQQTQLSN